MVHVFITFRIDYCNSLLCGISDYDINRLQRIQNSAPHIVTNTRKFDHIPIFQKLPRLPVRHRIHFKILRTTYKSINDMAPEHLCELIPKFRVIQSNTIAGSYLYSYGHMVIVGWCAAPSLRGVGCRWTLEICCLLTILNLL